MILWLATKIAVDRIPDVDTTYIQTPVYICDIDMDTQFILNQSVNTNWYISKYWTSREVVMRDIHTDRSSICTPLYR